MVSEGQSAAAVEQFARDGFIGPFSSYAPDEVERKFEPIREAVSHAPRTVRAGAHKQMWLPHVRNRHFDLPAVAELCFHPAITAQFRSLLGPDLILWRSNLFIDGPVVGWQLDWHQDEYRLLLEPACTDAFAHVAVTAATEENCVAVLPGSHRLGRDEIHGEYGLRFVEGSDGRGDGVPTFEVSPEVREALRRKATRMILAPGEFFVSHPSLLHASNLGEPGTQGDHTRIGIAIRVVTPSVRVLPTAFTGVADPTHRCVLLGGTDSHGINDVDRGFSPLTRAEH